MALISKATIAEINNRLDAVSVVGDYVRLEQKSGRWWGRCPFHGGGQEKTPSFKVDPDLKMYHCFGCNKGGSVIGFVMEMDKLTYPEALKSLANKMSIEIVYEEGGSADPEDNSQKEELYELYKRLTITFQHFLTQKADVQEYISGRGISKEIQDVFKLGFAPADRDFLHRFLNEKGYSDAFLEKSGLFSSKYKNIPLFAGRLMFPIADKQGKIVAFGGRALPGMLQHDGSEPPKYINSPETEIYKKGQTLFAIDLAKPQMRVSKTVYLAEGYMDVMALHQAGITNSVAPLGTAFTDDQAVWLSRWVENVILIFDDDEAGQKAAYKAILTCRKNGLNCSLVDMNQGEIDDKVKDPAEILQKFGSEILKKKIKFIINDFEYLILRSKLQFVAVKGDINRAAQFMFPFLEALVSEVERSDCITRAADIFKIERGAVQKDYLNWKSKSGQRSSNGEDAKPVKQTLQIKINEELSLLMNVAVNMDLYSEFRAALEIKEIDDEAAKELFIALEECYKHDESGIDSLLARINDEALRQHVAKRGTTGEFKRDPRKFMEDGIKSIKIKRLKKRITEIESQMRESERAASSENFNIDDLLAEKKDIDTQIRKLEGK